MALGPVSSGFLLPPTPPWHIILNEAKEKNSVEMNMCVLSCSVMSDSVAPWTVASHAPLPMEFSRQEYWSGLPFPTPRALSHPGIQPASLSSPALAGGIFTINATYEAQKGACHLIRILLDISKDK